MFVLIDLVFGPPPFFQMYFNSTISDSTKLLKPVLVFAFAIAAALTGLTQITQHRSHPIDVYVGFLIGAFIAVYLVSSTDLPGDYGDLGSLTFGAANFLKTQLLLLSNNTMNMNQN